MRPPSYYNSLAGSGSGGLSSRSSSQQLRSSLSSPSSSSYASRTHLPYAAQSTLVAHCFTAAVSTTRPYSSSSSSGYSSSASSLSTVGLGRSYTASSYSSSRPLSTKRHTSSYTTTTTAATYAPLPRPSYLSGGSQSAASSTRSVYRPSATSASYYKPIRLRERPLLTQISRQIHSTPSRPLGARSSVSRPTTASHSASEGERSLGSAASLPVAGELMAEPAAKQSDESWSSDVARNISRNKYLIKFREFDKQRPSLAEIEPDWTPEAAKASESAAPETAAEPRAADLGADDDKRAPLEDSHRPEEAGRAEGQQVCDRETTDKTQAGDQTGCQAAPERQAKGPAKRPVIKKRNVKVKLKPVASSGGESTSGQQAPETGTVQTEPAKVKRAAKAGGKSNKQTGDQQESDAKQAASNRKVLAAKQESETRELSNSERVREVLRIDLAASNKQPIQQVPAPAAGSGNGGSSGGGGKRIRFREYHYDDFNFLTVLGHGGWGFVVLAELKEHDTCFAVKCIKKITIVEDDDFDSILIERKMLTLGNIHPFICKLFCTFETEGYLFFVMEYCPGGDLMFHVQREGKFSESRCRFYAAEIICAIRFLHNKHIIYRDLKLDNILLDAAGHVRLVDFGMCQCRTYREEMLPSNFCGTPEYISPEIIKGVPYNHSVDWWSFGVLLYEMAVGKMPFRGNDENELLWNVCYEQIHYPMFLSRELHSLLQLLLEREPTKRMGMATCKAGDIYEQPFFRGVDWKAVEELRVAPPFVPEVNSKRDVQNFDSDFTESACELSPVDEGTLARIDQTQFQKFPYTNPEIKSLEWDL